MTLVLGQAVAGARPAPIVRVAPTLDTPPTWSLGLAPYAGLGLSLSKDRAESFPVGGGLFRLTLRSTVIGVYGEAAVLPDYNLTNVGGLLGATLPFRSWVDIDALLGLGMRTYENRSDSGYFGDYRISLMAASVRTGISDRTGELVGLRLGGQLVACLDINSEERRWEIEPEDGLGETRRGARRFGALTLAFVITVGLDVEPDRKPLPPAPESESPALGDMARLTE